MWNFAFRSREIQSYSGLSFVPPKAQLAEAVDYTNSILPSVLDMIWNHVIVRLWALRSTCSLLLLLSLLWFRVIIHFRVLSIDQIQLCNYLTVKTNDWCYIELFVLHSNNWDHLTVQTNELVCLKCYLQTICLQIIYDL